MERTNKVDGRLVPRTFHGQVEIPIIAIVSGKCLAFLNLKGSKFS